MEVDYVLYSVGANMKDDGGVEGKASTMTTSRSASSRWPAH